MRLNLGPCGVLPNCIRPMAPVFCWQSCDQEPSQLGASDKLCGSVIAARHKHGHGRGEVDWQHLAWDSAPSRAQMGMKGGVGCRARNGSERPQPAGEHLDLTCSQVPMQCLPSLSPADNPMPLGSMTINSISKLNRLGTSPAYTLPSAPTLADLEDTDEEDGKS